jgi:hypothetical protein
MESITVALVFVGLAAVAVSASIVARLRRRVTTNRFFRRSGSSTRPGSRRSTAWFASDPVLFVGGDAATADCSAGGGSRD